MTQPTKQPKPSLNALPLKERMKVPRQHMLEQPPLLRATNFTEVNLGYSEELARQEALALPGVRQATYARTIVRWASR